jgi:dTDP-4-amino-4,6-dideoxygalactose transaminase
MKLPFFDLKRQYKNYQQEIDEAVDRVVKSGMYIGGAEVEQFEQEMAAHAGVGYAVGVSSGTDALLAALMALCVGEGDEVITSPFTFIATAEVVAFLGAKPVFVDVEPDTFNMDPDLLEDRVTENTKCIVPVHLFGHMADMHRIGEIAKKHGIPVIEDAAQAVGAAIGNSRACSFGISGCLSFFPSKNLGAFGDGGMVLTNSEEVAHTIRVIKEHGSAVRYHHAQIGFNGRLDALQAAVLRVKLSHLDQLAQLRREHVARYNEKLNAHVTIPVLRDGYTHVYNQYSILTDRRDELADYLRERGIPSAIYYPIALHMQEVFSSLGYRRGDFPVAESLCDRILSLPIFPEMTEEEQDSVVDGVVSFFDASSSPDQTPDGATSGTLSG